METKFYILLKSAVTDDTALVSVIDKIMPMINKLSYTKQWEIDEDLKSLLIKDSIEIIRKNKIYKIF